MGKFSNLGLAWWEEDDLEDLIEEHPEVENMTAEELEKFAQSLYWEAQHLIDRANSIENTADIVRKYKEIMKK